MQESNLAAPCGKQEKKRSGVEVGYVGTDARGPRASEVGLDIGKNDRKKDSLSKLDKI